MDRNLLHELLVKAGAKKLKRTGEGFACMCFFHEARTHATWNINADTGLWLCWNPDCGRSGNLFAFLVHVVGMSFVQATQFMASTPSLGTLEVDEWATVLPAWEERWKVTEPEPKPEGELGLYRSCPLYMVRRGFSKTFLRDYEIGWDPATRRVTFPVRDHRGYLAGFSRRAVDEEAWPKYLHDVDRASVVYLLHRVAKRRPLAITEGQVDALRLRYLADEAPADVEEAASNAVSTLGASLSERHVELIASWEPEYVVLAYDNDEAGVAGMKKGAGSGKRTGAIARLRDAGVADIRVLGYEGKDPGGLDTEQVRELFLMPSFRWLLQRPNA